MNKTLIVANWKMNPQSLAEAEQLFGSVQKGIKGVKNVEVVICPPFVHLSILGASTFASTRRSYGGLAFGSQDVFWEEKGAFTGEISSKMLKDSGCQYVIIGHSERRRYFNETDEMINKKLNAAIIEKLNPILCIGETQQERKKGKTKEILKRQLTNALKKTSDFILHTSDFVIAYEPIWAIGTGKACSPAEAKRAGDFIRSAVSKIYNKKFAENISILYGGSVNSKNAKSYIFEADFQGLLIGGASLKAKEFIKIIKSVS